MVRSLNSLNLRTVVCFVFKCCFLSVKQLLRLQMEKDLLKQSSEQETGQLWAQLESMRTSRQELGGDFDKPITKLYFNILHCC